MNAIKIYKYSLFLPLIVPVLFSPALLFLISMTETQALIVLTVIYSGLIGGLPYLILIYFLFRWMRDKSERQIRRCLALSPLLMIAIFVAGFAVLNIIFNNEPLNEAVMQFVVGTIFCSLFILIFGYSYVLLVFGLVRLFKENKLS